MNNKGRKVKNNYELPYLSFFLIFFSISGCIQASNIRKQAYDKVPWLFLTLRMSLPSCYFWSKWKAWSLGTVYGPTYSILDITRLLRAHCKSPWTPVHWGSTGILCSWGTCVHYTWTGQQQTADTYLPRGHNGRQWRPTGWFGFTYRTQVQR